MIQTSREEYGEKLRLYDKLVAANPRVQRKGATVPYTSLNGHMFSYLSKSGELALRLPGERAKSFLGNTKRPVCAVWDYSERIRDGSREAAS